MLCKKPAWADGGTAVHWRPAATRATRRRCSCPVRTPEATLVLLPASRAAPWSPAP